MNMFLTFKEQNDQVIVSTIRYHESFQDMCKWIDDVITSRLQELDATDRMTYRALKWFKAYEVFRIKAPRKLTNEEMVLCGLRQHHC